MGSVSFEKKGPVGIIYLSRSEALNALNKKTLQEILSFLTADRAKVFLLTSSFPKAFSAGADIKEIDALAENDVIAFSEFGQTVVSHLENPSFITIGAASGLIFGGGLELALGCDLFYAASGTKFSFPEITLGLVPGFGGMQRLASLIGKRRAKELFLTARTFSAEEAYDLGLVNGIFPEELLFEETLALAEEIASRSEIALTCCKLGVDSPQKEASLFLKCFKTKERKEATSAFLERKKWK